MNNAQAMVEPPRKTYFFSRPNGSWFACHAKEAWEHYRAKMFKLVGVSDGINFVKGVQEAHELQKTQGVAAAQERVRKALEDEYNLALGKIEAPPNNDYTDLGRR